MSDTAGARWVDDPDCRPWATGMYVRLSDGKPMIKLGTRVQLQKLGLGNEYAIVTKVNEDGSYETYPPTGKAANAIEGEK